MSTLEERLITKSKHTGRTLYAIAYMRRITPVQWKSGILYLHADDAGDARLQFFRSESFRDLKETHISGVAPVIGFHVNDNHGDDLTV